MPRHVQQLVARNRALRLGIHDEEAFRQQDDRLPQTEVGRLRNLARDTDLGPRSRLDLSASRSGVMTDARLRCRSCRSRTAPAHSQPNRASAPAHSSHHTTLPAAGGTVGTGTDTALSRDAARKVPPSQKPQDRRSPTTGSEAGERHRANREAKSRIRHAAERLCNGRHTDNHEQLRAEDDEWEEGASITPPGR